MPGRKIIIISMAEEDAGRTQMIEENKRR